MRVRQFCPFGSINIEAIYVLFQSAAPINKHTQVMREQRERDKLRGIKSQSIDSCLCCFVELFANFSVCLCVCVHVPYVLFSYLL